MRWLRAFRLPLATLSLVTGASMVAYEVKAGVFMIPLVVFIVVFGLATVASVAVTLDAISDDGIDKVGGPRTCARCIRLSGEVASLRDALVSLKVDP